MTNRSGFLATAAVSSPYRHRRQFVAAQRSLKMHRPLRLWPLANLQRSAELASIFGRSLHTARFQAPPPVRSAQAIKLGTFLGARLGFLLDSLWACLGACGAESYATPWLPRRIWLGACGGPQRSLIGDQGRNCAVGARRGVFDRGTKAHQSRTRLRARRRRTPTQSQSVLTDYPLQFAFDLTAIHLAYFGR